MKHFITTALLTLGVAATVWALAPAAKEQTQGPAAVEDNIAVFFSPQGGCEDAIVAQLKLARKTIDVQAYSFTNADIARAVADAKDRGVKVRIVLDKSNETDHYTAATFLLNHNIKPWIDGEHAIAHNKIIIIDGKTVITGSYNFTRSADTSNAENLLIFTNKPKIAEAYAKNFAHHLSHSEAYTPAPPKADKNDRNDKGDKKH